MFVLTVHSFTCIKKKDPASKKVKVNIYLLD